MKRRAQGEEWVVMVGLQLVFFSVRGFFFSHRKETEERITS